MEDVEFFTEFARKFSSRSTVGRELHATLDDGSPAAFASALGGAVVRAIRDRKASPDRIYETMRVAGRAAIADAEKTRVNGWWHICGDPDRGEVEAQFRAWAERVAVGADLASPDCSPEQAVQLWLHFLGRKGAPNLDDFGSILKLFGSSSLACERLANQAYRAAKEKALPTVGRAGDGARVKPFAVIRAWDQLEIWFTSDKQLQLVTPTRNEALNFAEFGLVEKETTIRRRHGNYYANWPKRMASCVAFGSGSELRSGCRSYVTTSRSCSRYPTTHWCSEMAATSPTSR